MRNIAVFSTSDLQTYGHETNECVSTGKLEKAIDSGYEVYVFTTRAKFWEHDNWWRMLVKPNNIIVPVMQGHSAYIDMMKRLYQALELSWNDSWESWTQAYHNLSNVPNVKLGYEF